MTLHRRADPLRFIAVRLALPDLATVVREPGIGEAYRVTVQYHDGRHPDQIGTLTFGAMRGGSATLTVAYRRAADKPLIFMPTIPIERARIFAAAIRALDFDRSDDMPDIPIRGTDVWLVERASGTFQHDVVLAPDVATGVHAQIAAIVRGHLREMVRAINAS